MLRYTFARSLKNCIGKRLSLHTNQVAHQAGAYLGFFCSMKRLGVFLLPLDGMLVRWGVTPCRRCGGLMLSELDSGSSGPGLSSGRGHFVVFLGKTVYSHSASLHPGVYLGTGEFDAGVNPAKYWHPIQGV